MCADFDSRLHWFDSRPALDTLPLALGLPVHQLPGRHSLHGMPTQLVLVEMAKVFWFFVRGKTHTSLFLSFSSLAAAASTAAVLCSTSGRRHAAASLPGQQPRSSPWRLHSLPGFGTGSPRFWMGIGPHAIVPPPPCTSSRFSIPSSVNPRITPSSIYFGTSLSQMLKHLTW